MARHTQKLIKVSCIPAGQLLCWRYRLEDAALRDSIKRLGILMPLVVRKQKGRYQVIAGHKRLHAARALKLKKVPAIETGEKLSAKDAFLFTLVSNWRQEVPEMDRARAIAKAVRELRFKPDEVRSLVMPLLGLPAEQSLADLYLKADGLPDLLKDVIEEKKIPFRACAALVRLNRTDQDIFARKIAARMKLTSSQCLQVSEWLADIIKRDRATLASILKGTAFKIVLGHRSMDPRTRADRFFDAVKRLRFPGYTASLERFEKARRMIARELRIEPAAGFEEPGIELHTRLKTLQDLDRFLEKLSESRPALNSLFDFML